MISDLIIVLQTLLVQSRILFIASLLLQWTSRLFIILQWD